MAKQIGFEGRTLIAFFKGTAGEFNKLGALAIPLMTAAADMRSRVSPFTQGQCKGCDGSGQNNVPNGLDDFDVVVCEECNGTGRVVANN